MLGGSSQEGAGLVPKFLQALAPAPQEELSSGFELGKASLFTEQMAH